jgi:hypothetical protein
LEVKVILQRMKMLKWEKCIERRDGLFIVGFGNEIVSLLLKIRSFLFPSGQAEKLYSIFVELSTELYHTSTSGSQNNVWRLPFGKGSWTWTTLQFIGGISFEKNLRLDNEGGAF